MMDVSPVDDTLNIYLPPTKHAFPHRIILLNYEERKVETMAHQGGPSTCVYIFHYLFFTKTHQHYLRFTLLSSGS